MILITHDDEIAAQVHRVIRIKDGKVEADFVMKRQREDMKMILKKFKKEKDMTELAVQKKTLTPEQKKKRKKQIIAGMAAVVIVGFAVSRMLTPAALPMVSVRSAQVGNIEQSVDASGTVTNGGVKDVFFSGKCEGIRV